MHLKRKFGLEFEHISILPRSELARELAKAEVSISSGEEDYSGWQVKNDGSITPMGKYNIPCELATPPLLINKFNELSRILAIVRKYGAINSSCGLHVHVSAPEFSSLVFGHQTNSNWVNYLTKTWQAVEKTMFTYVPPSRRNNHYCRPGIQWGNKYQAINFCNLMHNKKTIEFRLHNSTLNPLKAFSFAVLCQALVETMTKQKEIKIIPPNLKQNTKPKHIKTQNGGDFTIQREESGKWLIESKNFESEFYELDKAYIEFKKHLKLSGENYLQAFHYPHYGNAMTVLCDYVSLNGLFKGYMEDRYERMLTKHGPADAKTSAENLLPDEQNFYNEGDLNEIENTDVPLGADSIYSQLSAIGTTPSIGAIRTR